jgi:hypothetical protein
MSLPLVYLDRVSQIILVSHEIVIARWKTGNIRTMDTISCNLNRRLQSEKTAEYGSHATDSSTLHLTYVDAIEIGSLRRVI